MSHPVPVTASQIKLQETKGQMQEIMRLEYVNNYDNGL